MFSQINSIIDERKEDRDSPFISEKAFITRYGKGDGKVTAVAAKMKVALPPSSPPPSTTY